MTTQTEQAHALAAFQGANAKVVDLPILQPAEALLDLYGEDIRGRAYTARDPLAGELMLRPDFTLPVVQLHMETGADAARYAYAGKVFRVQEVDTDRPSEYLQVGFESLGGDDPAQEDSEVFAVFADLVKGLPLRLATGDIGVLIAAVQGLSCSERRKQALMRHLWRPARFKQLLDQYAGRRDMLAHRTTLVTRANRGEDILAKGSPMVGLRSEAEIWDRVSALSEDAREPAIPQAEADVIEAILHLRAPLPQALEALQGFLDQQPALNRAVDRFEARLSAFAERGLDPADVVFEGSYGRTNMEYYDGFVFGFYAEEAPLPPVATGGRYDALTRAMGRETQAVGGMLRPALLAEMRS